MIWIISGLLIIIVVVCRVIVIKDKLNPLGNLSLSIVSMLIGFATFLIVANGIKFTVSTVKNTTSSNDEITGTHIITDYIKKFENKKEIIEYKIGTNIYSIETQNEFKEIIIKSNNPTKVTIEKKEEFNIAYFTTDCTYTYFFT